MAVIRRRRIKQILSLKERLLASALKARERAAALRNGPERQKLLRQARIARIAAELDEWLSSPGLRPPR
jgi:hypothetical protein